MDSDLEIIEDSIEAQNHSIGGGSSSDASSSLPAALSVSIGSSKQRVLQQPQQQRSSTTATTTSVPTAEKYDNSNSSSDIEIIAGPPSARTAGKDLTNKLRSSSTVITSKHFGTKRSSIATSAFKSAAVLLKEENKKEKIRQKRSSSVASSGSGSGSSGGQGIAGIAGILTTTAAATVRRSSSPYFAAIACNESKDIKGKAREDSSAPRERDQEAKQLEDEDDDFLELPPPLRSLATSTGKMDTQLPVLSLDEIVIPQEILSSDEVEIENFSPGAILRQQLGKFKAPSAARSTASRARGGTTTASSLFGSTNAGAGMGADRWTRTKEEVVLDSAASTVASTSTSTSTSACSTSTSLTSTKRTVQSLASTSTSASVTEILTIPTPFLAVINVCPVCSSTWTLHKESKLKLNHIKKCAITRSYSNNEVNKLVEEEVRKLRVLAEENNRRLLEGKTLLEGVVSRKGKEVQVVGVEKKNDSKKAAKIGSKNKGKTAVDANDRIYQLGEDPRVEDLDSLDLLQEDGAASITHGPVLLTQGGSAYSQATSTQVQKELNKRIKNNQRIGRGDFLRIQPTPAVSVSESRIAAEATGSGSGGSSEAGSTSDSIKNIGTGGIRDIKAVGGRGKKKIDPTGINSKNWLKAASLLKAREKEEAEAAAAAHNNQSSDLSLLSAAYIGATISSTLASAPSTCGSLTGMVTGTKAKGKGRASSSLQSRLESYNETKYRLAEKAKDIAAARTKKSSISSDSNNDESDSSAISFTGSGKDDNGTGRAYRNPSDLSVCLVDKAIRRASEKKEAGYDAWDLAGSGEDPIKDRFVSSPSPSSVSASIPSSPIPPHALDASTGYASSSSDLDLPPPLSDSISNTNNTATSPLYPVEFINTAEPNSPIAVSPSSSSPPIGNLTISSSHRRSVLPSNAPSPFTSTSISPSHSPVSVSHRTYTSNADVATASMISGPPPLPSHSPLPLDIGIDTIRVNDITNAPPPASVIFENDSSSGLFKSSAALQALTQRLKASSSSSSTRLGLRAAAAAASALASSRSHPTHTTSATAVASAAASVLASSPIFQGRISHSPAVHSIPPQQQQRREFTSSTSINLDTKLRVKDKKLGGFVKRQTLFDIAPPVAEYDGVLDDIAAQMYDPMSDSASSSGSAKRRGSSSKSKTEQAKLRQEQQQQRLLGQPLANQQALRGDIKDRVADIIKDRVADIIKDEFLPAVAAAKTSPKRRKKSDNAGGDTSAGSEAGEPSLNPKQGTIAFTATKKGKSTASTSKKTLDVDLPSPKKKKTTAKATTTTKGKSVTSTASTMPDYETWSKEDLQSETGKYGYKPAGNKNVLVGQLVRVWQAIHPEEFPVEEKREATPPWRAKPKSDSASASATPDSSPASARKKKSVIARKKAADTESDLPDSPVKKMTIRKKKAPAATAKGASSSTATTAKSKAIAAARAKRKAALSGASDIDDDDDPDDENSHIHDNDEVGEDEVDTDTAPEDLMSAGEKLREAILRDEKFYLRILRYEPILFDDFELVASNLKIKMSKVALRDWLDSQGIIFYYDQTTGRNAKRNGVRKRHA